MGENEILLILDIISDLLFLNFVKYENRQLVWDERSILLRGYYQAYVIPIMFMLFTLCYASFMNLSLMMTRKVIISSIHINLYGHMSMSSTHVNPFGDIIMTSVHVYPCGHIMFHVDP